MHRLDNILLYYNYFYDTFVSILSMFNSNNNLIFYNR